MLKIDAGTERVLADRAALLDAQAHVGGGPILEEAVRGAVVGGGRVYRARLRCLRRADDVALDVGRKVAIVDDPVIPRPRNDAEIAVAIGVGMREREGRETVVLALHVVLRRQRYLACVYVVGVDVDRDLIGGILISDIERERIARIERQCNA